MTPKQLFELCGKSDLLTGAWTGTAWEDLPEATRASVAEALLEFLVEMSVVDPTGTPHPNRQTGESPMFSFDREDDGSAHSIRLSEIRGFHFYDGKTWLDSQGPRDEWPFRVSIKTTYSLAVAEYNRLARETWR